ncbi:MAG: hypothetical protein ACIAQU_01075 [Phycisphaerales bacterium JB064]
MPARGLAIASSALLASLALAPGCAKQDSRWTEGLWTSTPPDYPFVPNRVLVHPLTRASKTRDDLWALRIHFFFLDAWDDQVKGLGRVQVQLFADGQWEDESIEPVAWEEINLSDLTTNRRHYDHVTRTYVLEVPQDAMPAWLVRSLDELESKQNEPGEAYRTFAGPLIIRVVYEATMANGEIVVASNDFTLAPG